MKQKKLEERTEKGTRRGNGQVKEIGNRQGMKIGRAWK